MSLFKNPYPSETCARCTVNIGQNDLRLLKRFRPIGGVIDQTLSIIISKLCHELRNTIPADCIDQSVFDIAVLGSRVILGGTASSNEPVAAPTPGPIERTKAVERYDRRRVASVARGVENDSPQPTSNGVASKSPKRKNSKGNQSTGGGLVS